MSGPPPPPPPPTAAAPGNGAAVPADLDAAAVEGIPRETLVALLKRKDKEAKAAGQKLDKLEERYVKVVRFNKILMEDRTSFQRFCGELLPDSEGTFEEAAAQETPVNLDALLRRLASWRSTFEAVSEDRRTFQQFIELVFPGDETVQQLLDGSALGPHAFDTLQHRWIALEDRHNQSIASINAMAREQVLTQSREFDELRRAKEEAERRVEEMRDQLTQLAREKAHTLKHKLQGGAAAEAAVDTGASVTGLPAGLQGGSAGGSGLPSGERERLVEELRQVREASERRERELREAAEKREQELQNSLELHEVEVRRLKKEADRLYEEGERKGAQARQLLAEKDTVMDRLQQRATELEQEMASTDFISRFAEQQAGRDAEVKAQRRQVDELHNTLAEIQRLLNMSYTQERVLKDRIRELEGSQGRGQVAGDYLKHVVLKYITYNQTGDLKAQSLVPVLVELLRLSAEERRLVEGGGTVPQALLFLNQAVGGAGAWFRGGAPSSGALEGAATAAQRAGDRLAT